MGGNLDRMLSVRSAGNAALRDDAAVLDRLKSLRCLVAVARHGSTIAAAEALYVSQPAVTRAVIGLERAFELRLFERASRGMLVTEVGGRVAQRANVLLDHLARGAHEAAVLAPAGKQRRAGPDRFAASVPAPCLRALVAVATSGSEAKAAKALGVSQPAVHRSLRSLEQLSGLTLFQTSPRGTRLTEPGEALLRRAKLAFAEARAIEGEIAAWRGTLRGRIVVGVLPLSVGMVVPQAVNDVLLRHPDVEISIVDGTYESLTRQLRSADIDVIVGALRPTPGLRDITQQTLLQDDLAVIARAGHPALSRRGLKLKDLLAHEWIVPLADTPASVALHRVFSAAGLPPPSSQLQASSPAMTRALVLQTDRLALASWGQAKQDEAVESIRIVPVDLPGTTRAIGVTLRGEGEPSPDLSELLDALRAAAASTTRS